MGRQRSLKVAVVGGLVALFVIAGSVIAASTAGVRIGETNDRYHFRPGTTYVNIGGTVTWTNGSDATHTVTSDTGNELASPQVDEGKTYSHTFAAIGTFAYHCTIHDYMVGKVVVLAAGVTAPPTDASPAVSPTRVAPGIGLALLVVVAGVSAGAVATRRFRGA